MLDIKYVREHLDEVAETMKNRHASFDPEQFTALDVQRREVIAEEEALQAERNKLSKEIGALMGQGKTDEAQRHQGDRPPDQREAHRPGRCPRRGRGRHGRAHALHSEYGGRHHAGGRGRERQSRGAPLGHAPRFRRRGLRAAGPLGFGAGPEHHRFRARREAGREPLLRARRRRRRLERALIAFMLDQHTSRGYKEWWVPALANAATLTGTASCRSSRRTSSTPPRASTSSPRPRCS